MPLNTFSLSVGEVYLYGSLFVRAVRVECGLRRPYTNLNNVRPSTKLHRYPSESLNATGTTASCFAALQLVQITRPSLFQNSDLVVDVVSAN